MWEFVSGAIESSKNYPVNSDQQLEITKSGGSEENTRPESIVLDFHRINLKIHTIPIRLLVRE